MCGRDVKMSKFIDFFKKIPITYYNWKKRNENLEKFLNSSKNNEEKISEISRNVKTLTAIVNDTKDKVQQIDQRLDVIESGTKIELFDTLHNWRVILVSRGWASAQEKKEIQNIWHIYHEELKGNGQGARYYEEIMNLPESIEEMEARNNV